MPCIGDTLINSVGSAGEVALRDDASFTEFQDNLALYIPVDDGGQVPEHDRHILVTDNLVHFIGAATQRYQLQNRRGIPRQMGG